MKKMLMMHDMVLGLLLIVGVSGEVLGSKKSGESDLGDRTGSDLKLFGAYGRRPGSQQGAQGNNRGFTKQPTPLSPDKIEEANKRTEKFNEAGAEISKKNKQIWTRKGNLPGKDFRSWLNKLLGKTKDEGTAQKKQVQALRETEMNDQDSKASFRRS